MSKNSELLIIKAREATGKLLYAIIAAQITPFEATKYFPKNMDDASLKIAWHALLHYDADEELRHKDPEYAQEQIKYIELLAKILVQGKELPNNLLDDYEKLYSDTIMPKENNFLGRVKAFFRFTN